MRALLLALIIFVCASHSFAQDISDESKWETRKTAGSAMLGTGIPLAIGGFVMFGVAYGEWTDELNSYNNNLYSSYSSSSDAMPTPGPMYWTGAILGDLGVALAIGGGVLRGISKGKLEKLRSSQLHLYVGPTQAQLTYNF